MRTQLPSPERSECPSCGSHDAPARTEQCAERIAFYNCQACDFSTWEPADFLPSAERTPETPPPAGARSVDGEEGQA